MRYGDKLGSVQLGIRDKMNTHNQCHLRAHRLVHEKVVCPFLFFLTFLQFLVFLQELGNNMNQPGGTRMYRPPSTNHKNCSNGLLVLSFDMGRIPTWIT